jgi:hypothetical protein
VNRRRIEGALATFASLTSLTSLGSLALLAMACDSLVTKPLMYTSVQVHVERLDGSPIGGIQLLLYTGQRVMAYDSTNSAGLALFQLVPAGPAYGVMAVVPPPYRDSGEPVTIWQDRLVIEQGVTDTVTLRMSLCQGSMNVTVADPVHGVAQGVQTYLYTSTATVDSARTGSDGGVHYAPACGNYGVRIIPNVDWSVAPGRGTEFADGLDVHRAPIINVALAAQYNTCRGAISVTVVDATGVAVPGATLLLYSADSPSNITSVETGGTATFGNLGCGIERGVTVTPPAGWSVSPGRGGSFVDGLSVTNGTTLGVTFTLTRVAP